MGLFIVITMTTEISFYHLTTTPIEISLPKLLEKALDREMPSIVLCKTEATMDMLNEKLWTYSDDSFLPHGSAKEPFAAEQLIYLTTNEENPNNASFLATVEGWEPTPSFRDSFTKVAYFFDGGDEFSLTQARAYWKTLKAENIPMSYWQQNEQGGWSKKG